MSSPTVSVVVAGFPAQLRRPKPLPGETLAQVAIRNNSDRWKVCIENLIYSHGIPAGVRSRLLAGKLDAVTTPGAQAEVERFVNICLPTPYRTLTGLARLQTKAAGEQFGYTLGEILWTSEEAPPDADDRARANDERAQALADALGVRVVRFPAGAGLVLDLARLIPQLRGDFAWLIPGGTTVPFEIDERLERVLRSLTTSPQCALYSDNIASYVVRTSCLRELVRRGEPLPSDPAPLGRLLRQSGYELIGDEDPELALCELEREFGGWTRNLSLHEFKSRTGNRPWWRKLFGG